MSKKDIVSRNVQEVFEIDKTADVLYACQDGHVYFKESHAQEHALKHAGGKVKTFCRGEASGDETGPAGDSDQSPEDTTGDTDAKSADTSKKATKKSTAKGKSK